MIKTCKISMSYLIGFKKKLISGNDSIKHIYVQKLKLLLLIFLFVQISIEYFFKSVC